MLVRDEGGGGRGLTTSRNKSAIGGRNLFVDGPLLDERVYIFGVFYCHAPILYWNYQVNMHSGQQTFIFYAAQTYDKVL